MSEPKFSVGEEVIFVGDGTTGSSGPAAHYYGEETVILSIVAPGEPFSPVNINGSGQTMYVTNKMWLLGDSLRKKPKHDHLPADADWQEDFNRMLNRAKKVTNA